MVKCKHCGSDKLHRMWKKYKGNMIEYLDYYICQMCGSKTKVEG